MAQNFIFYDTETTGRDAFFDQILQYAAVSTDAELNRQNELELRCRRLPHIIPNPAALLVNNIMPISIDQAENSSYEFACRIQKNFESGALRYFLGIIFFLLMKSS